MSAPKKKQNRRRVPEISNLRRLWTAAKQGDQSDRLRLANFLIQWHSPDAFIRGYNRLKNEAMLPNSAIAESKPKSLTPWERARATLPASGAVIVSGGLPSLGKKSK